MTTPKRSSAPGIIITLFAAFGGILFGYDSGTIAGIIAMPAWLKQYGYPNPDESQAATTPYIVSTSTISLVVSILAVGEFTGALFGSVAADQLGRKMGVILASAIFAVGVAMQTAAAAVPLFIAGRLIAGLGVGLLSTLVPMYQSECAPKWIRGTVVGCYQLAITVGIFLASLVNNATENKEGAEAYQIPISIQLVFASILAIGMATLPESPRWYVKWGKTELAVRSLCRLNGTKDAQDELVREELKNIEEHFEKEKALGERSYADCFKRNEAKILMRTMTGIFIQAWQQLTGVNFIFYYSNTFFKRAGFSQPFLLAIIISLVNVLSTLPGMFAVERIGRRNLLLIGAAGMTVCEFIVAAVGVTMGTTSTSTPILITFICIYIFFFASTWGPIAWIVTGEIFPLNVRAKGMSLSIASNWLWNFVLGFITPYMIDSAPGDADLGVKVFFIWGCTCAGAFLFAYFFVYETKGLTLEQVDDMYTRCNVFESQKVNAQIRATSNNEEVALGKDEGEGGEGGKFAVAK
ncbi:hypothetical protein HDU96_008709 [Phlyctochytrium bullatum]|nr:hypothetical protein HDU96_008709 [Phlyctochytrium bullatum]